MIHKPISTNSTPISVPSGKGAKTPPAVTRVKPAAGFSSQPEFPPFPKPVLYGPEEHYAAPAEYPLLYRNHFAPYGNYKGSPYTIRRAYNTYKGSPYVGSPYVRSPYVSSPYVSSPYVSSPYNGRPYGKYGYYVYPWIDEGFLQWNGLDPEWIEYFFFDKLLRCGVFFF